GRPRGGGPPGEGAGAGRPPPVLDPRALEPEPDEPIALGEETDRDALRTHVEAVLLHRLLEDAAARDLELVPSTLVGVLRDVGERHVLDATPVDQRGA